MIKVYMKRYGKNLWNINNELIDTWGGIWELTLDVSVADVLD